MWSLFVTLTLVVRATAAAYGPSSTHATSLRRAPAAQMLDAAVDEAAFLELVTVKRVEDAAAAYARYGVVRVPELLSASEAEQLAAAASERPRRRGGLAYRSLQQCGARSASPRA